MECIVFSAMKRKDEITDKAIVYGAKNPGEFVETPYFSQVGGLYSQSDIEWAFEEGALWEKVRCGRIKQCLNVLVNG